MTGWVSQILTDQHDISDLSCGSAELDRWLRESARRAHDGGTARTYVWTAADDHVVRAYFAVTPTQVRREEVSRSLSGGVSVVPAYLIAKLAVARELQGRGLGGQLLLNALEVVVAAAERAGGRLIVVDAIDDAAHSFYLKYDFIPIKNSARLVMKVATARAALTPKPD